MIHLNGPNWTFIDLGNDSVPIRPHGWALKASVTHQRHLCTEIDSVAENILVAIHLYGPNWTVIDLGNDSVAIRPLAFAWTSNDQIHWRIYAPPVLNELTIYRYCLCVDEIEGILPKGPYRPCVSMAGRALSAGYSGIRSLYSLTKVDWDWRMNKWTVFWLM